MVAIHLIIYRRDDIETKDKYLACAITSTIPFLIECVFFINNKAKANLFLRMKLLTLQQKQMLDLLDSVPDKVLICSQKHDNLPVGVYSNRKMTQFFGRDIVQA